MEEQEKYEIQTAPPLSDDNLIQIALNAEKRIEAVKKIKKIVLRLTDARDWTNQNDKPYLGGSGCTKVAGVFGIGWTFIGDPIKVTEEDGHYRYDTKLSVFMSGRITEAIGARSSKDPFFTTRYRDGKQIELPPSEIDSADVLKASITNAQAIGITNILGIKNLSWEDLEEGGIKKANVTAIQYKKKGEAPKSELPKKEEPAQLGTWTPVDNVTMKEGKTNQGKPLTRYSVHCGDKTYYTFDKKIAEEAKRASQSGLNVLIDFKESKFGLDIIALKIDEPPEEGEQEQ